MTMTAVDLLIRVRPAWPADLVAVAAIERASYAAPWTAAGLRRLLTGGGCGVLVATVGPWTVGFVVTEVGPGRVDVVRLAVTPGWRRRGVGRRLLAEVIGQLGGRTLAALAPEPPPGAPMAGPLLLKAVGFRARFVMREAGDSGEDLYWFVHPLNGGEGECAGR